jgi:hypothetical protein
MMERTFRIMVLPGDGVGPEVTQASGLTVFGRTSAAVRLTPTGHPFVRKTSPLLGMSMRSCSAPLVARHGIICRDRSDRKRDCFACGTRSACSQIFDR